MRWRSGRRSGNIEDRRGRRVGRTIGIGGGAGLVLLLLFVVLGGDPSELTQVAGDQPTATQPPPPGEDEAADFVSAVLASTEDAWGQIFAAGGATYEPPRLVLFTDYVESACGLGSAASGPFYCPPDRQVYLDLGFFRELARLGGAGDFAAAYVIGHEVGHHVQNLTGTADEVRRLQARASQAEANSLSVRLELQADCLAGVWAHHADRQYDLLEPGDVEEGLAAAAAIGDDRLQRNAGRAVNPESFTHGSSDQRARWLRRGLETGELGSCDTFGDG